jgi:excisionase family DNA binding protein
VNKQRNCERRTNPRGGRRATDLIVDLVTHQAKHVTPRQIAAYCDVSLQTVYKWIGNGTLPRVPHFTREFRIKTDHFRLFVLRERKRSA